MTGPIILAYDGSPDAKQALTRAGALLCGPALVVHVYSAPQTAAAAPTLGAGLTLPIDPVFLDDPALTEELDQRARERASAVAAEGVALARAAGFDAEAQIVMGDGVHGVWNALAALGDERQASVIVVGHRDVSWLQGALRGSVAGDLVKHISRPLLVIPAEPAE
jgi:nucleotide-binding universal stress UspA family protein